jgi:hypothetical protein
MTPTERSISFIVSSLVVTARSELVAALGVRLHADPHRTKVASAFSSQKYS